MTTFTTEDRERAEHKLMNANEPVAWAREDGVIAFHKKPEVDSQGFKWFALYTHPAKELTDKVMSEHCTCYKLGYSPLNNFTKVETK